MELPSTAVKSRNYDHRLNSNRKSNSTYTENDSHQPVPMTGHRLRSSSESGPKELFSPSDNLCNSKKQLYPSYLQYFSPTDPNHRQQHAQQQLMGSEKKQGQLQQSQRQPPQKESISETMMRLESRGRTKPTSDDDRTSQPFNAVKTRQSEDDNNIHKYIDYGNDEEEEDDISIHSTMSHLFGECISVDTNKKKSQLGGRSNRDRMSLSCLTSAEDSESGAHPDPLDDVDLESPQDLNGSILNNITEIGGPTLSYYNDRSSTGTSSYYRNPTTPNDHDRRNSQHSWINRAKGSIARASDQVIRAVHFQAQNTTPKSRKLSELSYLRQVHRTKVESFSNTYHDDQYDFCLVLAPQEVYSFWADLLDFRVEMLGEEAAEKVLMVPDEESTPLSEPFSSPHTDETVNSDSNSYDDNDDKDHRHGESDRQHDEASPGGTETTTSDLPDYSTPLTGIHRRRGKRQNINTPMTASRGSGGGYSATRFASSSIQKKTMRPRLSLFERAVFSSPLKGPGITGGGRNGLGPVEEASDSQKENKVSAPNSATITRRRWGNHALDQIGTPNIVSPPIKSLTHGGSTTKRSNNRHYLKRHANSTVSESEKVKETGSADAGAKKESNLHILRIEDIPNQVIPRGIAARRKEGIVQFLSALKRGIVVRRHRSNMEAHFCRIYSNDGGDTIQYQYVDHAEAMNAFKEQRVRYNRVDSHTFAQSWSHENSYDEEHNHVPDFIAAQNYREKMIRQKSIPNRIANVAVQIAQKGSVRAADIIAVHPARHEDPRSKKGELGTASLRKSKSEHAIEYTFSLVSRVHQPLRTANTANIDFMEDKWNTGEGNEFQFTYINFEAATEGEYWLVFRGFLLLHRDAASGRFAMQRAAGMGSHFSRIELEQRVQHPDSEAQDALHKNEFNEPVTVGCLEKLVVKLRKMDTTYMEGFARQGAVPPPSDYFLGFRFAGTQIWSRLRQAGFDTQRIYGLDTRQVLIKVRCPSDRLMDVAEVLRLKLKTREGCYAPFREEVMDIFEPLDDTLESQPVEGKAAALFRSSHRQTIIDFIIGSRIRDSGAELSQTADLGKMIAFKAPLHMHAKLDAIYDVWCSYWKYQHWKERDGRSMSYESTKHKKQMRPSPIGNKEAADEFMDNKVDESMEHRVPGLLYRFFVGSFYQPLDSVEEYFGEKVAFYFAWLQHCASHLVILTVAGLIVFICQLTSQNWDHPIRPFFSIFIMLWSFVVLVNWRKRSNFLAYRWGTIDYKEQETTRPQFKGDYVQDHITNEWVVTYPKWKRWLKYMISVPLTVMFTIGSLLIILLVHANRDLLLAHYFEQRKLNPDSSEPFQFNFSLSAIGERAPITEIQITRDLLVDPTFWILAAGLPSALGLCLPLMNFILMNVSYVLNDFENYKTESEYRSSLIIKVFSFRFVCHFGTLYYYAFVSIGDKKAIENGYLRVGTGLLIYTTVAHWWTIFLQVYLPLLIRRIRMKYRRKRLQDELNKIEEEEEHISSMLADGTNDELKKRQIELVNKRLLLDQAQDDTWLEMMRPQHDSFPEYIQAVVQFAYITCFSVVLPITPFICLVNHLLSMRLDAFKLCKGRRRPLATKTGGIGVWEHLLNIVVVISVLTNCWLMGFTNSQFSWLAKQVGSLGLFAVVVGWEHCMLLIKYILQTSMSQIPKSVRDSIRKEQHRLALQRNKVMRVRNGRRSRSQHTLGDLSESSNNDFSEPWRRPTRRSDRDESLQLQRILSAEESTLASC